MEEKRENEQHVKDLYSFELCHAHFFPQDFSTVDPFTFSVHTVHTADRTGDWRSTEKVSHSACGGARLLARPPARPKDAGTVATLELGAIWPCIATPPPVSARHGVFSLKIHTSHVVPAPDSFTNYSPTLNTNKLFCLMPAPCTATVDLRVGSFSETSRDGCLPGRSGCTLPTSLAQTPAVQRVKSNYWDIFNQNAWRRLFLFFLK